MSAVDRGNMCGAGALGGMNYHEEGFTISCAGDELVALSTVPESPATTGVLIIVGGPQYRVGSHRQFVLLARMLASSGYAAMRFDYRGMGDASGGHRTFDDVSEDIGAALGEFARRCPSLERFVLWGLCDAASASLLYLQAAHDSRIAGVALLNPWVRSDQSLAQTHVKHYYTRRLADPEFWGKFLRGRLLVGAALRSFAANLAMAVRRGKDADTFGNQGLSFQDRMAAGLDAFRCPVLLVLSERDLTAKEFVEFVKSDRHWSEIAARSNVRRVELQGSDHTFSSAEWRDAVGRTTVQWLDQGFGRRQSPSQSTS